jgi:hypothetical protein
LYDCRLDLQRGVHVCVCHHCGKTIESLPEALGQQAGASEKPSHEASGPGTELSKLLKRLGIEPTPTCQCRAKAAQMDAWGPDECEKPERIEEVVAVMRAEAEARGLPFLDVVGRLLVRRAIRNARRAASNAGNTVS